MMNMEEHTRSLYCYEDELPCNITDELFSQSFVDGVRLYPWRAVAKELVSQSTSLLDALEAVSTWLDEPLHNKEGWPTKEDAMSAFKIGRVVNKAIRKHKGAPR